ncbi:family 1 glycosylhydrolase [Novosphingobium huizhouense]|uniref:family 1 glycosylhydrolase n=1 Tax=Novosphingobium huizhouense TaxID=2866625 RepID=UPI001CD81F56|nr:family 1 glycosylhydrolase [Novosphingobium huizhouense]
MIDRRTLLAAGAASVAAPAFAKAWRSVDPTFPEGFLWGAATAGHQVEGNNINSDIWLAEHVDPTVFAEPSGDAANSFELWRTDLDLVKAMGLNTYRFGIEWARIEPEPGQFSIAMLDHYKAMIEGCRDRGLTPVVTFNHFTTPRWFAGRGGWEHDDAAAVFARYCDRAARHIAEGIGYATTLNEPNLAGVLQDLLPANLMEGDKAMAAAAARAMNVPFFQPGSALYIRDPAKTQAHMLEGHAQGRAAIKAARTSLPVGVSLAIIDDQAVGRDSQRDARREKYYGAWLRAARQCDFLGIQNYERAVWNAEGKLPPPADAKRNTMGAEVYPPSLANVARYAHAQAGVPIMVTEHGVGTDDDSVRAWLIPAALAELKKAMAEGVPVLGYIHWSLVDNFEWVFGYRIRFGLHTLDRTTFKRTPKPSAAVLGDIARRNSL